ncbi:NAD-dependent epimerase/dehydratase family protein [Streptomyces sp. enrichment culture]|uniref:NAD-dependent epimerase/dehydratase family protein n=1 Tax=Streptomyces sp. enrichment culture TaxID=1795815 RepID=UPI003F55DC39
MSGHRHAAGAATGSERPRPKITVRGATGTEARGPSPDQRTAHRVGQLPPGLVDVFTVRGVCLGSRTAVRPWPCRRSARQGCTRGFYATGTSSPRASPGTCLPGCAPSWPACASGRWTVADRITTPFDTSAPREVLADVNLTGRRALVTGGASGVGTETVRALADAVRGAGRARAARLDLADIDSVRALTDSWEGPSDVLVANAGIMALPDLERSGTGNSPDHFALALGLRHALRRAGSARVVAVSSGTHRRHPAALEDPQFERTSYDRWVAYGRSKSAMVLLAAGIAERWARTELPPTHSCPGGSRHGCDATPTWRPCGPWCRRRGGQPCRATLLRERRARRRHIRPARGLPLAGGRHRPLLRGRPGSPGDLRRRHCSSAPGCLWGDQ